MSATTGGITFRGVVRGEWVKLRSLRSSVFTVLAAAAVLLGVGLIFAATAGTDSDGANGVTEPAGITLTGAMFAQLVIGVLGVLVITGEYATGMIRSTLTAVPSRLPVLAAKAGVVTAVVFPVMIAAVLAVFFGGQIIMGANGFPTTTINAPGVTTALLGTAATMAGVAVMGVALGTLLRNTAGAITTLVALLFLVPGLGGLVLPASWRDNVLKYLPSTASDAFTRVAPGPELLSAGTGAAVFAAWVVVPLLTAAVTLRGRDV
ncbi:ABC transporter permease subunit [Lentzea sp. NPDC034063]|uniref:ABC transporter permease n=1 Tax=unclassified Lentzea TaxID=2643253 RepID=UPI0033F3C0F6